MAASLWWWALAYAMITMLLIGFWVVGEEGARRRKVGFVAALLWWIAIPTLAVLLGIEVYRRWRTNRNR